MRALLLCLTAALGLLAGCSSDRSPDALPADFAGSVEYRNGTVAPPYHYEWTAEFTATEATVRWRPGYAEATEPWTETVALPADRRAELYRALRAAGAFEDTPDDDGLTGGSLGSVRLTADGRTYSPGTLGRSRESQDRLDAVRDAVMAAVPTEVWDGMQRRQEQWGRTRR
ncbi:hypothetical protein [Actinokineospora sp.]|uniref:hypothetical protein n=1 Tax=Actinokineospora sp. TaxID=1872133 RepID=UPI0040378B98